MNLPERYSTPADLPAEIPVFPLQGCILLPRTRLPLNVFEPRYLAMIEDVIRGERVLGIIQPDSAGESESPRGKAVPLRRVGCAARLTSFEERPDGRLTIGLTGICRFEIVRELETATAYRRIAASYAPFADDLAPGSGEADVDRDKLLAMLRAYIEGKQLKANWPAIEQSASEPLINELSMMSPYGPAEKQALLEAATLAERAAVLTTLAEMEIAAGPGRERKGRLQ